MMKARTESRLEKSWQSMVKVERDALSSDPEELRDQVLALIDQYNALNAKGRRTHEQLLLELQRRFGRRSERQEFDGQKELFPTGPENDTVANDLDDDAETAADEPLLSARPKPKKKRNGRRKLPESLPREEILLDLDEDERRCSCCDEPRIEIGREFNEVLDYVPASLIVKRYIRPKYACKKCADGILTAEPASGPIRGGLPGAGLLAQVVVAKYCDHLPLYRQESIFARHGLEISRSTQGGWVQAAADMLTPFYQWLSARILEGAKIHTDDTSVLVLDAKNRKGKKKNKTKSKKKKKRKAGKGYLWAYVGDSAQPYVVFDYTSTRGRAGPQKFLDGYAGYLQADDYPGYEVLYRAKRIKEVACWAHVRRKFYDAKLSDRTRANAAIELIRKLYDIERSLHDATNEERQRKRVLLAKPVLDKIEVWLLENKNRVLPKSLIARAINYAINLWPSLIRYVDDGELDIDNNAAERAIKPIVLGRKNWLFAGSDDGARRGAVLASVIATCKRHGLDPFAYLRDLFERLPTVRGDLAELTPAAWKASNPAT